MFALDILFIKIDFEVFCKKNNKDNKMCLFDLTGAVQIFDRLFFIALIMLSTKSCQTVFNLLQSRNRICLGQSIIDLWSKLHTVQDEKCESIQKCLFVPPRINKLIYASFSVYLCTVV